MSIVISNAKEDDIRMNAERLVVWMELAHDRIQYVVLLDYSIFSLYRQLR
jgi:hypothetical protein